LFYSFRSIGKKPATINGILNSCPMFSVIPDSNDTWYIFKNSRRNLAENIINKKSPNMNPLLLLIPILQNFRNGMDNGLTYLDN